MDQEVHTTAGREAGATGSRPIGTVHAIGYRLYTNRQNALAAPAPGLLFALVLYGGIIVGIANRILRLADGRLNFALDLLNGASCLSSGIAGQVSGMPLCAWIECSSARQPAGL